MATLSPVQIVALIKDVDLRLNDGKMTPFQLLTATYIVLRESGGVTNVRGKQDPRDRGLWQWNRYWHPDISDMQADDPVTATEIAFRKSNGWTDWSPWNNKGTNGKTTGDAKDVLDPKNKYWSQEKAKLALQALVDSGVGSPLDIVSSMPDGGSGITDVASDALGGASDTIADVAGYITDPLEALAKFLGKLMSPTFWKRIGIGALGLAIVAVAIILFLSKTDTAQQVTEVGTP